jgi:hypothetical protein
MKMRISKSIFSVLVMGLCLVSYGQNQSVYMGGDAALITLPNGAIINKKAPELTAQTWVTEPEIVIVADGVWSLSAIYQLDL